MKLKFADNYNLFVIYLVLNLCGYNDENNREGMHPIRKEIREYFKKHGKSNIKIIKPLKGSLKKYNYNRIAYTCLLKREHPRVRKFHGLDEALLLIKKFEKSAGLKEFYKSRYLPDLNKIIKNEKLGRKLIKYEKDISDFVEIKTNWQISVVVNFLDAYWRGNNYRLLKNYSIITTGPTDRKEDINWVNIVHEALHCILRVYFNKAEKNFSVKLIKIIKQKTLDKNYKNNTAMHQIEEVFIRAFTPLIMGENLQQLIIQKFPLMKSIYKQLKEKLIKGKIKFNQKILNEVLNEIENL